MLSIMWLLIVVLSYISLGLYLCNRNYKRLLNEHSVKNKYHIERYIDKEEDNEV